MFELAKKAPRNGPSPFPARAVPARRRVGGEPREPNDRAHVISSFQ
jgi:hypothetical protein